MLPVNSTPQPPQVLGTDRDDRIRVVYKLTGTARVTGLTTWLTIRGVAGVAVVVRSGSRSGLAAPCAGRIAGRGLELLVLFFWRAATFDWSLRISSWKEDNCAHIVTIDWFCSSTMSMS